MEFFQQSAGKWRSHRTTHHLAFRRSEFGESEINVEPLTATDPSIVALCELHQIDPNTAIGGCRVRWEASMDWDKDEEQHEGNTAFALVPDPENPRQGKLLRELGYAEIVPVVGDYELDDDGGLVLVTEYETMSSVERFWFASPDLRMRSSTVKRFGGFSSASFCTESRITPDASDSAAAADSTKPAPFSVLGW